MIVDRQATAAAVKAQQDGIVALNKLFRVSPAVLHVAGLVHPKKRGGESRNGRRVRRKRLAAKRRTTMRMVNEFHKRNGMRPLSVRDGLEIPEPRPDPAFWPRQVVSLDDLYDELES